MIKKFRALKENIGTVIMTPACMLIIILLMSACATGSRIAKNNNVSNSPVVTVDKKPLDQKAASSTQATQAQLNKLPQFTSTTGEPENSEISSDDDEIVCHSRKVLGSLFSKKICLTKKAWAKEDKKNSRKMDRFNRDLRNRTDAEYDPDPALMGHMLPH